MEKETLTDTFCKLRKKLHIAACQLLKDEMEAEDAVQDAFCNLWASEVPGTADATRYKLFAILRNVCLNKLKRKRPESGGVLPDLPDDSNASFDSENLKTALLRSLTPLQRKIFSLTVDEEMEYDEIAESLSMSIEAVRANMCRARKTLREQYKKLKL